MIMTILYIRITEEWMNILHEKNNTVPIIVIMIHISVRAISTQSKCRIIFKMCVLFTKESHQHY